ncbi:MAG: ABC transporter permease [Mobilicoccus sp.]|nr:ABC transporter permease [Mobilicoccus sp.]
MTPVLAGALRQARIETRLQLFTWTGLTWIIWPGIGLAVLYFMRDLPVMESALSVAQMGAPGLAAMYLVYGGVFGISGALMLEREDGTLLRAKAIPGGMAAHLLGGMLTFGLVAVLPIALILVAASFVIDGVLPSGASGWALFAAVTLLGLAATMPAGALLGALLRGPMALGVLGMLVTGSFAISGIFYPLAALPAWVHGLGQLLPTYWIGLGYRAAILPPEFAALELHGSWQTPMVVIVLAAWALVGSVFAPWALRRMARRQSGSAVAAARERVMSRGY